MQNELQYQDVVQLSVPGKSLEGPEGTLSAAISQSKHICSAWKLRLAWCNVYVHTLYNCIETCTCILNLAQYYTSHNVHVHVCTGSGTCVGFNPFLDHLFLVGSESGHIYKCSKAYTKHFLDVTKVHVHVCTMDRIQLALVLGHSLICIHKVQFISGWLRAEG